MDTDTNVHIRLRTDTVNENRNLKEIINNIPFKQYLLNSIKSK